MNTYIQLQFQNITEEKKDWLIGELNDAGFDGFEEADDELKAFIPARSWNEETIIEISERLGLSFQKTIIEEQNWNQLWESSFEPVIVEDFAGIRADFHPSIKDDVTHEIIITPKMSFGTGHHATTYQMIRQMRDIDFKGKTVFDFGTGTGVLAILAEKLGAREVFAIDIDEWSIENAGENLARNDSSKIELLLCDSPDPNRSFDIVLANINKHIIMGTLPVLAQQLGPGGILLLSGLLAEDEADIVEAAGQSGLRLINKTEKHNWLCLRLSA